MKQLLLIRHAKSDGHAGSGADHERPINARGQRAAANVGRWLRVVDQVPQAVLSSSAVRTRTTVETAASAGEWGCPIEIDPSLYLADPDAVVQAIAKADPEIDRLMVAGHEPGMPLTAGLLVGGAHIRFPTAGVARIDLYIDRWADVKARCGELVWLLPPRLLDRIGSDDPLGR